LMVQLRSFVTEIAEGTLGLGVTLRMRRETLRRARPSN
jgi:hypothetical protein